jgi:hypothetical protein
MPVPVPRAVLIGLPPLLADTIRAVLAGRTEVENIPLPVNTDHCRDYLYEHAPDIVVLYPTGATPTREQTLSWVPGARVFTLSADLRRLEGPRPGTETEFTVDALITRLEA